MINNLVYASNVTSQANFASLLRGESQLNHTGSRGKLQPVLAKTDFILQQQMMGVGCCKDLDEWLVGSGESAETAESKRPMKTATGSLSSSK